MDFRQLETFLTVVQVGSFSRAGEKLYITQPTVTLQVKALEEELSQQLLERSPQGVHVTPAGKRVYEYAMATIRERDVLLSEFGCISPDKAHIRIAASSIPGHYLLPQFIAAFRKRHPCVHFDMTLCNSAEVSQNLLEHRADLGLCGSNAFLDGCEYTPVAKDRLVVITSNEAKFNALAADKPFPCDMLQNEPMILRENGSGTRREFETWYQKEFGSMDVNVAAVMSDTQAIKNAVVAGAGIAVLSERAAADYISAGFVLGFRLKNANPRNLFLVQRRKAKLMGRVKEFQTFIKNTAQEPNQVSVSR